MTYHIYGEAFFRGIELGSFAVIACMLAVLASEAKAKNKLLRERHEWLNKRHEEKATKLADSKMPNPS